MANTAQARALREQPFSEEEQKVVVGCLLGDGTLTKAGKNYRLRVEHQVSHLSYVWWKYQKLKRFCVTPPQAVTQHGSYRFGTVGHPWVTQLRTMFYTANGIKRIPDNLDELVNPQSIAIWFMDDGYVIHRTVGIAVHSYSQQDIEELQYLLSCNGVKTTVQVDGHGPRLYVPTESYLAFETLVKPTVNEVRCMAYKLHQPRRDHTLAPAKVG